MISDLDYADENGDCDLFPGLCSDTFNCCDCGQSDIEGGCGFSCCFSCNACSYCLGRIEC